MVQPLDKARTRADEVAAFRLRDAAVWLLPISLAWSIHQLFRDPQATAWVAWQVFFAVHGLIPLLDLLLGQDHSAPRRGRPHRMTQLVLLACLPAWMGVLLGGAAISGGLDTLAWWGLALSCGATGGIVAINVGHELIHRTSRLDRTVGGLLLASVGYGAFKVEHVRGHHLRVATNEDPATARQGESLWAFVPRSVLGTLRHALQIDAARGRRETLGWSALTVLLWITVAAVWGIGALVFVWVASAVAIIELEVVNYIEHYGLQRTRLSDGRYEPVDHRHSWNANSTLINAFLLNLQRHADHHAHAGKPHTALRSEPDAPQLPAGYGAMVLIAWIPPLWRAIMDPRIPGVRP